MAQQMLGPAALLLLTLAFLMEMAMLVWLNNSDGLYVHACIIVRQACERGRVDGWPRVGFVSVFVRLCLLDH